MPIKTRHVSRDILTSAPLPEATSTYTVIPHEEVMRIVSEELASNNLEIEKELYRASHLAQIASGALLLKQGSDQEMKMMFTWSNSYDKSMRFKCAVGGYLPQSGSCIVPANIGKWSRKHTGTANTEMVEMVRIQLKRAGNYYNTLILDKENMKTIILTERRKAELLGILYVEHNLLSSEQLNIVCRELKKPSFQYTGDPNSLWMFYCYIIYALQTSHPKLWMDQQRLIHFFICDLHGIDNQPKTGKQITLFEAIATAESESNT